MTGIQALERLHPTLPMVPGLVERQAFEYIRHGTLSLISGLGVATGEIVSSTMAPTRNEADFSSHVQQLLDTDPGAEWIFIADGLNTPPIGEFGSTGCPLLRVGGASWREGEIGSAGESTESRCLFNRSFSLHSVCVYPQALLLAESNRDLVQHFGSPLVETWQLHQYIRSAEANLSIYRVLQRNNGEAV
jgi:hypothetical protein